MTPHDGITGKRGENGASVLQRALSAESAATLGRLGRAVERALARLRDVADADGTVREDVEYACAEAVWYYFVQRETCGLVRHDSVIETYQIPASVLAKVGARRPLADAASELPERERP